MKIALAQQNYIVGDFEHNVGKIISAISTAKTKGACLVVFSELSVCGYPPYDLLCRTDFIQKCLTAVEQVAKHCIGISAIVGAPSPNPELLGKPLLNSAYLLSEGKIQSTHHKALLPSYDIFEEARYFEPNHNFTIANLNGKRIAITISEDLCDDQPMRRNKISPMAELKKLNPDLVINIAASPFSFDNYSQRIAVFADNAKRYGLPIISVNQVGANTDLIFHGGSVVYNANGFLSKSLNLFVEDIQVVDTESRGVIDSKIQFEPNDYIAQIHDALVLGIRDYFQKSGFTKATLGLSGGLDSAVTLALAQKALGSQNLRVLLLPSQFSSQHSIDDAVALADNLKVKYDVVNIKDSFDTINQGLEPVFDDLPNDLTEENIQARIRGLMLMALSNKLGYLLLNTSNKSEAAVGYGTLYGDMCGALAVLGDVYKTDVFKLAHYINREVEVIPINTIVKPPSAELRPDQKDSDSLPDYAILDAILREYIENQRSVNEIIALGFDAEVVAKAIRLVNANGHKRFQSAPILRVSSKAFGLGRKMPLVARF
ncbi:MAG: NAD+ synthase [Bacteroidales bacterium]|nr:NAD+ synthase [Bacteroidales bacterium]MDD4384631.1 NAD+ synthase [Bacteroidales bacterium]MDY0197125.1 NAD+ synthase [Tenuifilaceae bacterium]